MSLSPSITASASKWSTAMFDLLIWQFWFVTHRPICFITDWRMSLHCDLWALVAGSRSSSVHLVDTPLSDTQGRNERRALGVSA